MRKSAFLVLLILSFFAVAISQSGATFAATSSLTGADAALEIRADRVPVSAESGEAIARAHLESNAASLGLGADDLAGLRVTDNVTLSMSGARVVYFQQTLNGIGVHNAVINVTVTDKGAVLFVGNRGVANLAASANRAAPVISQEEAVAAAARQLGMPYSAATVQRLEAASGVEQLGRFSGGDLSEESIPVKLAYQPMADGSLRLAWDMNLYQLDGQHWWHARVDAATGELLDKVDWVVNENFDELIESGAVEHNSYQPVEPVQPVTTDFSTLDGSSYKVYPIPVESPHHTSPLPPSDARVTINQPANSTASPHGWHDTNNAHGAEYTVTRGNNVWAGLDVVSPNGIDTGSEAQGGAGLDFLAAINLGGAPSTYRPAAVTNLFVWNNYMHDVSYLYGFNEVEGNFQSNNYGRGGLGNDYVRAEAQDYSGTNNANFATPPDGQLPRMQMYIGTTPNPDRDGDLDNGVVAHEYGHGISNRLTGGPNNTSCLGNQEQAGEGWSDWQALIFTMKPGDTAAQARGIGTYLFGQGPNGAGIRPAPYSTNTSVNNYTYNNRTSVAVPHGVGFLWATMVWEMNWNLIAKHGFNSNIYNATALNDGNILAHKLVMDGMAIQPCSPGFVDARNAILTADQNLTGGQNQCEIWAAFAKRGLGYNASQGSSNSLTDGAAGFNTHPSCTGTPPTATPPPGPTPTRTPTPPPTGGSLANGNFEQGRVAWTESSGNGYQLIGNYTPYQGSWNTWLCGYNNCVDMISQNITVPSGGATLYYRYRISSTDVCGYDYGYVRIGSTNLATYNLCSSTQSSSYVQGSVSLNAYAGQTVNLNFRSTTDVSYSSSFRIDNVGFTPSFTEGVPEAAAPSVPEGYVEAKPAIIGPEAYRNER